MPLASDTMLESTDMLVDSDTDHMICRSVSESCMVSGSSGLKTEVDMSFVRTTRNVVFLFLLLCLANNISNYVEST